MPAGYNKTVDLTKREKMGIFHQRRKYFCIAQRKHGKITDGRFPFITISIEPYWKTYFLAICNKGKMTYWVHFLILKKDKNSEKVANHTSRLCVVICQQSIFCKVGR